MNLLAALMFCYSLTLGANSGAFLTYDVDPITRQEITWPLYIDLQAEMQLGPVFIGGGIRDSFTALTLTSYSPLQNDHTFKAGLRFNLGEDLQVEAGYAHTCTHPEAPYSTVALRTGQQIAIPRYEGALDSVFFTTRGSVRPLAEH